MISLEQIKWIKELISGESVVGETREVIYPLDILRISESRIYRITEMEKNFETGLTKFTASKT